MALKEDVEAVLRDFDAATSDMAVGLLRQIQPMFRSDHTKVYLERKIRRVEEAVDEDARKELCKTLLPYLDWYAQGSS